VRAVLGVRDKLVRTRAGLVTLIQALLSGEGIRVPTGSSVCFEVRLEKLDLAEDLRAELRCCRPIAC
jgi:hypothetical protein